MDPVGALIVAACALVPAGLAFAFLRHGRLAWAVVLTVGLALTSGAMALVADALGGWDGLIYAVLSIGAAIGGLGALVGLIAGWVWRKR